MVNIKLSSIGKTFAGDWGATSVFSSIDVNIHSGEIVAIRGDNGCGKTTLLNIMAGIDVPTEGSISFDVVDGDKLRVGYAQQDYTSSLLPWFDVLENVALPLRIRRVSRERRRAQAADLLGQLEFDNVPGSAFPSHLSGGQRQRVAVARALISEPHLLLLDEPFANLDAHTTRDLQEVLLRIHSMKRPTIVYVSHELDQCIYLADRILTLHGSPSRVIHDRAIALPRPRERQMILGLAFTQMRSEILAHEEPLYAHAR